MYVFACEYYTDFTKYCGQYFIWLFAGLDRHTPMCTHIYMNTHK